jgi:hypothetical protein
VNGDLLNQVANVLTALALLVGALPLLLRALRELGSLKQTTEVAATAAQEAARLAALLVAEKKVQDDKEREHGLATDGQPRIDP